jgi:hypothetical protein
VIHQSVTGYGNTAHIHTECITSFNLIEDYNIMKLNENLHQIIIGLTRAGTMLI